MVAERVAAAMTGPDGRSGTAGLATRLLAATEELAARCALDPARDLGVGARHLPAIAARKRAAAGAPRPLRARDPAPRVSHRPSRQPPAGRQPGSGPPGTPATALSASWRSSPRPAWPRTSSRWPTWPTGSGAAGIRCAIRGSGAGSFVNHLLGISAIDPLEHDLLMERFLSPIRATLPDIDLDVESARRLDAYRIIFDAYGTERTACVCHDGDLPGAQRDQGRRRRDVAAARTRSARSRRPSRTSARSTSRPP